MLLGLSLLHSHLSGCHATLQSIQKGPHVAVVHNQLVLLDASSFQNLNELPGNIQGAPILPLTLEDSLYNVPHQRLQCITLNLIDF